MLASNNLSDVDSASTSLANINGQPRISDTFYVNDYGADPTGATFSDTAFTAAANAANAARAAGVNAVDILLGVGTYKLNIGNFATTYPRVDVLGPGQEACVVNLYDSGGAGIGLSLTNPGWAATGPNNQDAERGGDLIGWTLDGTNCTGPSIGVYRTDQCDSRFGFTVRNFSTQNGIVAAQTATSVSLGAGTSATVGVASTTGYVVGQMVDFYPSSSTGNSTGLSPSKQTGFITAITPATSVTVTFGKAFTGTYNTTLTPTSTTSTTATFTSSAGVLAGQSASWSGGTGTVVSNISNVVTLTITSGSLTGTPVMLFFGAAQIAAYGATGFYLKNIKGWSESNDWIGFVTQNNQTNVVFDSGSMSYNQMLATRWYIFQGQDGIVVKNSAAYGSGRLNMGANVVTWATPANTGSVLNLAPNGDYDFGQIVLTDFDIQVESDGALGTGSCYDLKMGKGAQFQGVGTLIFSTPQASQALFTASSIPSGAQLNLAGNILSATVSANCTRSFSTSNTSQGNLTSWTLAAGGPNLLTPAVLTQTASATSATSAATAGGAGGLTVTVTVASTAGYGFGQKITVAGMATDGGTNNWTSVNGTWQITNMTGTTQLSFVVTTAPTGTYASSTSSGTIKLAANEPAMTLTSGIGSPGSLYAGRPTFYLETTTFQIYYNVGNTTTWTHFVQATPLVLATSTHQMGHGETVVCTSGTFVNTLPFPQANDKVVVANTGAGTITVHTSSGTLYNASGASGDISLAQGFRLALSSDGTNWYVS